MTRTRLFLIALSLVAAGVGLTPAEAGTREHKCDFDGDGDGDLAMGVSKEGVRGTPGAGAVHVVYGSFDGVTTDGDQFIHQDTPGMRGSSERDDEFGRRVACGDFDGDGFDDLAVSVPKEDLGAVRDAGAFHVIPGSRQGLRPERGAFWSQQSEGVNSSARAGERFGAALAAGDFNADGIDDLAVGVPGQAVMGETRQRAAGGVQVFLGEREGLMPFRFIHQNRRQVRGNAEAGDRFGTALATGDFNGDGRDDLAVGIPAENGTGAVQVFPQAGLGPGPVADQHFTQNTGMIGDTAEPTDRFAEAVAAGDVDDDGDDDLVVGVPGEDGGQGAVHVLAGSAEGVSDGPGTFLTSASGAGGPAHAGQRFGKAVAAGDFDRDADDDLAVGVPGYLGEGAVDVFPGSPAGVVTLGSQRWHLEVPGVRGEWGGGGTLGASLATPDLDGDGAADLVAGNPTGDVGAVQQAGSVTILYSVPGGLTADGDQLFHQDLAGMKNRAEDGDRFGNWVA